MSDLVTIGRFSQITGLSIKALRIYAQEGLLAPAYIDPNTGYRYYHLGQGTIAWRIRLLRYLEMPLDDIWSLLNAQDDETTHDLLDRYQTRINQRIARDQHILLLLQRLRNSEEGIKSYSFEIKKVADQPIIGIRIQAPLVTFTQVIKPTMSEIKNYAISQGIFCPERPPLIIQHAYSEEEVEIEACLVVKHRVEIERGERINSRILAGGAVAFTVQTGPYEEVGLIYPALYTWVRERGYEIDGPARVVFWDGPWSGKKPEMYRTETAIPVRDISSNGGDHEGGIN